MRNPVFVVCGAVVLAVAALPGVLSSQTPAPANPDSPVLYENARLIPGDGAAAIERASMLVEGRSSGFIHIV